ncbi:MAG: hypothetical protein QXP36_06345 [Conexivisphaerales archaeon]
MRWSRFVFSVIIIAVFIISYSVFSISPSSNSNNTVTLYILVPSAINASLQKASFLSNYNLVGNYSILASTSNYVSSFSTYNIHTVGELISYSLKNYSAEFINGCLNYKIYLCDNRTDTWALVYINSLNETVFQVNSSTLNLRLSSLNSPDNILILVFSKTVPSL